jgi:L-lactate dehydrogenase complex protein LldG
MSAREDILARIRRAQPAAVESPALPVFEAPEPMFEAFAAALERMGGKVAPRPAAGSDAQAALRALFPQAGVVCSATPEITGTRALAAAHRPADLDDVDVGVVRAAFGVAETGSVLLTEAELQVEAIAFLPQHLLVLLDPARIVATLHDAYRDPAFARARYAVLLTGPSATADIEGVLVHGAQGVRSLTVLPLGHP